MTKRLKKQILILAMASMGVILSIVVAGMNIVNYRTLVTDLDEINHILIRSLNDNFDMLEQQNSKLKKYTIRRIKFGSRYFRVTLDEDGKIEKIKKRYIDDVSDEEIRQYARTIMELEPSKGFVDDFRYRREAFGNSTRIVCVYAHDKVEGFQEFLQVSILMAGIGYLIVYLILRYGVKRFVRPIEEANRKQQRFIADAGHEIKTPLAVIGVNVDVLKMEDENNECLDDIVRQVKRLNNLTQELLYLSNMSGREKEILMQPVSITELLEEARKSFVMLAKKENKQMDFQLAEGMQVQGNQEMLEKLVYILLDNAVKYAREQSVIDVLLYQNRKTVCLVVGNRTDEQIENVEEVFERFYRTQHSRESGKAGYGIGLSIAKSVVELHKGTIQATLSRENYFAVQVQFSRI